MSTEKYVAAIQRDSVLQLTLNRPDRKNAINLEMYQSLVKQLNEATQNPQVRVVVLTGAGGEFTSGNDLQDFMKGGDALSSDSPIAQFLWTYTTFPKPVIVAVDGVAVGIGTTLLLHSDMVFASAKSEFSLPFTGLGLCPEYAASYLLPRLVGYAKASEWLLLGENITASQAAQAGLINRVVDNPLVTAWEVAKRLAIQPPSAVRKTKALLKSTILPKSQKVMVAEVEAFIKALQGQEFAEAATAFFEKRPADFSQFE